MYPILLNIDYLLNELDKSFYTMPLMIALNILFLVIAAKNRAGGKTRRVLYIYAVLFLIENLAGIIISLSSFTPTLGAYAELFFVQIEFIAFYIFFYHQFNKQHIQNKIAVTGKNYSLATVFVTLFACIFPPALTVKNVTACISITNSIMILIPAFYYFYTLFLEPPTQNLLQEPSFWITTGIAFLHGLNIPIFLIENYLLKQFITVWYSIYSINYIAYCILFILLIISLLCNRDYKQQHPLSRLSPPIP